jgi:hypothetical protein
MKKVFILTTSVFYIFICLSLFSCEKEKEERIEYYKSQNRDPLLIGYWKSVNENNTSRRIYDSNGVISVLEKEITSEGVVYIKKEDVIVYYYTKGNKLYTLRAEKGIKYGIAENWSRYEIRNDTLNIDGYDVSIKLK